MIELFKQQFNGWSQVEYRQNEERCKYSVNEE